MYKVSSRVEALRMEDEYGDDFEDYEGAPPPSRRHALATTRVWPTQMSLRPMSLRMTLHLHLQPKQR